MDSMHKIPMTIGTRLSAPSLRSNTKSSTNSPAIDAIARARSGS